MVFKEPPEDFSPQFEIVGCFVECDGKCLMIRRLPHKSQGGRWGNPAGKIEKGETPLEAAIREIREETGIVAIPEMLREVHTFYVRHSGYDFVHRMHHLQLSELPEVTLNPDEHSEFRWCLPEEALALDLIDDQHVSQKLFYTYQELEKSRKEIVQGRGKILRSLKDLR